MGDWGENPVYRFRHTTHSMKFLIALTLQMMIQPIPSELSRQLERLNKQAVQP
jgi:hypothetical protein